MLVALHGEHVVRYAVQSGDRYYLDDLRSIPVPTEDNSMSKHHRKMLRKHGFRQRDDNTSAFAFDEVNAGDMINALGALYHHNPKIVTFILTEKDWRIDF